MSHAAPLGDGGHEERLSTKDASRVKGSGRDWSALSEEALVEAARTDRAAFGALYDRHFAKIYAYIARRVGDEETAEDISAAVWERALVAIERFEVRGVPFAAWLYRIAGNLVANHHRRGKLLSFVTFKPQHDRGVADSERLERRAIVRQAMAQLSVADQEVLGLGYYAGLAPPQIADVLGCSIAAVHKRLHRARKRLRALLEEGESSDVVSAP